MEEICSKQDDFLSSKDAKIKDLKKRLVLQKQTHKQQLSELEIQRQQERYIAQNTQKSRETSRKPKQRRVTFRWQEFALHARLLPGNLIIDIISLPCTVHWGK